jgi:hypothetical protein
MENYQRRERKSIWLSNDEFNTLNGLKQQYENSVGSTDWGKFLLLVLGIAIGSKILSDILSKK